MSSQKKKIDETFLNSSFTQMRLSYSDSDDKLYFFDKNREKLVFIALLYC